MVLFLSSFLAISSVLFLPSSHTAMAADTASIAEMFPTNVRSTPIAGGARVEWDPVSSVGQADLGGGFGGASIATRYFVVSSYDPSTNSGYRTCIAPAPSTSCIVTGLVNGVSYTFQVKTDTRMVAHNSPTWTGELRQWSNYSPPSEPVTPCCNAPSAVSRVQARVVGDSVDVTWSPPSDWGGASSLSYVLTSIDGTKLCLTEATSCRITELPFSEPHTFAVTPSNASEAGPSQLSEAVTIPTQAPQAPRAGSARYTRNGQARVAWQAPSRDGGSPITEYVVKSVPEGRSCSTSGSTSCTIDGLRSGRTYAFTVRAVNRAGTGAPSAPIVAGKLVTPASTPRLVRAEPSVTSVRLSWSRPLTTGGGTLLRYVVEDGSRVVCQTTQTSCSVLKLAPGSEHRFKIYAVSTSGRGRVASVATRTTVPSSTPPAPTVQSGPAPSKPEPSFT